MRSGRPPSAAWTGPSLRGWTPRTRPVTPGPRPGEPVAVVVDDRFRDTLERTRRLLTCDPAVYTLTGPKGQGLRAGDRSLWGRSSCTQRTARCSTPPRLIR